MVQPQDELHRSGFTVLPPDLTEGRVLDKGWLEIKWKTWNTKMYKILTTVAMNLPMKRLHSNSLGRYQEDLHPHAQGLKNEAQICSPVMIRGSTQNVF